MNVELFSCSGGMAEGFRRAGILFDVVVDYDEDARASYEANLGHRPIGADVHDLVELARNGFGPRGEVELLVADPPCTPWSRAGKRLGLEDDRDMLRETAELVRLWRPQSYLIGNIPGLQDASSWGVVQDVIGGLARDGYCVDDYAQLDAADFGVPQHRVRPFWFGHIGGPCLKWPTRTHCSPEEAAGLHLPGIEALRPWVTCRGALRHLPLEDLGRPVRLRWKETKDHRPTIPAEPAKTLTTNTHGDGRLLSPSRLVGSWKNGNHLPSRLDERIAGPFSKGGHPPSELDLPARTVTGRETRSSGLLLFNSKHPISSPDEPAMTVCAKDRGGAQGARALAWPWDVPSTTVCAGERQSPPGRNGARGESQRGHPNAVVLSERAAKILQGFPETWVLVGKTKRSRWSQLGMAMPPPLAEVVARAIAARSSL